MSSEVYKTLHNEVLRLYYLSYYYLHTSHVPYMEFAMLFLEYDAAKFHRLDL